MPSRPCRPVGPATPSRIGPAQDTALSKNSGECGWTGWVREKSWKRLGNGRKLGTRSICGSLRPVNCTSIRVSDSPVESITCWRLGPSASVPTPAGSYVLRTYTTAPRAGLAGQRRWQGLPVLGLHPATPGSRDSAVRRRGYRICLVPLSGRPLWGTKNAIVADALLEIAKGSDRIGGED